MAKKRKQNKFGHTFVCEWLGTEWFRDDQGKITGDDGKYAGDAFNKLINEQYPIVAPVELEKVKKKRGRPPKVSVDTAKPKPEDEEEDKPGRTKRILRALYPDLFEAGEKMREIWAGEKSKDSKGKDKKQMTSTRGGRLFDVLYPGVRNKASDLKSIFTGDKNKDEEQKTDSEKKRQDTKTRLEMERIQDSLNDNGDYLRDLIAVQQRSANLLSQIADNIKNLSGGGGPNIPNIPDLPNPITATVATVALGAYGAYKAGQGVSQYAEIPNREDKNALDASSTKPDGTEMTDAEMREQAFNQRGKNMAGRETNTKPVIPETKPAATDIATSKETEAIAEAKQKQVKAENILTFKGDEIRFNADRLTFDVQSLTIENKGQAPAGATGPNEGSSGGGGATPKDTGGAAGGGTGSSPGGTGTPNVEGAPVTGPGKDKSSAPPPTLTEEQKKDLGALTGEGIKADDPRAKQFSGLNDEQLKAAGIEKTPDGGFKQSATAASGMTDEEVSKKTGTGKFRPEYKLTSADLSDDVLNTIAGEARMKDPASVDAVINNMFNRLGAQGYGPSANLQQVARAPGQYEGYRKATEKEKAMLRERIQAVADGNVEDTTKGADQYRATSYMKGAGAGKTAARTAAEQKAEDLGGNTFFKSKNAQTGPYAAYATTGKEPPPSGPATPEQIAQKRQKLEKQEVAQRQTALAGALNTKQTPAAIQSTSAPVATSVARPEMTAEDKKALAGEELTPTSIPDATKLPGGDEGLKDRDVRSANLQNASNIAEKQYKEEDAAKLDASQIAGYETSFDVGTGPQGLQPVAAPIPEPPRRPADLTTPPQADNKPAPPSPKAQEAGSKEQRQRSVESHSSTPGGNGAQFLEAVFRIMPYLLHQKKHAPQVGRRWHY